MRASSASTPTTVHLSVGSTRKRSDVFKRLLIGGVAVALAGGVGVTATSALASGSKPGNGCETMPHLWSGAEEINHDVDAGTVTFVWGEDAATLTDTDPGCAKQPGLAEQLAGIRSGVTQQKKVDCADLQALVDSVREERRSQGLSTSGRVPVSEHAAEAAARKNLASARFADTGELAAKMRSAGPRTIDLDQSDDVLAGC